MDPGNKGITRFILPAIVSWIIFPIAFLLAEPPTQTEAPPNEVLNGGYLTLRVPDPTGTNPVDVQTLWAETGELDSPNFDRLLDALAQKPRQTIKLATVPSAKQEADRLRQRLENHGFQVEVETLPEEVNEALERIAGSPPDISPPLLEAPPPKPQRGSPERGEIVIDPQNLPANQSPSTAISEQQSTTTQPGLLRRACRSVGQYCAKLYSPATRSQKIWGITSGLGRTGGALVWFTVGIDPLRALAVFTLQSALGFAMRIWTDTADNAFLNRPASEMPKAGEPPKPLTRKEWWAQFLRRMAFEASLAEIFRMMSGAVRTAHSAFTPEGQAEILTNIVTNGTGFSLTNAVRTSALRNGTISQNTSDAVGSIVYVIGVTLAALDLAGVHMGTVKDLGFFEIHGSTVLMAVNLFGSAGIIKAIDVVKSIARRTRNGVEVVENTLSHCSDAMSAIGAQSQAMPTIAE